MKTFGMMIALLCVSTPRVASALTSFLGKSVRNVGAARGYSKTSLSMKLQTAIVGLPNVGKSTLFNALTETQGAEAANYPFCTIEPNIGIVSVPDPRLDVLGEINESVKVNHWYICLQSFLLEISQ